MEEEQTPQKLVEDDIIEGTPEKTMPLKPSFNLSSCSPSLLDLSLNNDQPQIVSSTGIFASEKMLSKIFCQKYNFNYTDNYCVRLSILIVKGPENTDEALTFKYFLALASKAKIVKLDWVKRSLTSNRLLPLEPFIFRYPCKTEKPILEGITIVTLLIETCYPSLEANQNLLKLTGATLVSYLQDLSAKATFPRFILFEDENQLTTQILSKCSRYLTLAIRLQWVFDSLKKSRALPIIDYLSSTFSSSPEIMMVYHIPTELLQEQFSS